MTTNLLAGIPIVTNPYMPETSRFQFRFPRSKRVRIRKKWAKKAENYREEAAIFLVNGAYIGHPKIVGVIRNFTLP